MATATIEAETLADILHAVGDVSLDRIRLPIGSATEDDVIKWLDGDDKHICELVDGVLVEKAMGFRESLMGAYIAQLLNAYAEEHDLGIVTGADGPYRLRPGRVRFPDTGFISWDQFPDGEVPADAICDAVPDLAVEVISEGNTRREMELKLRDYFAAGVRLVWYVYPKTRSALVYTSPTRKKEIAEAGALDGGKILPGFSLPLAKVFDRFKRKRRRGL
jgi:Uma2 family endonuclease